MSRLALVLAGGGSLGAYEVGAIEALNELGYKFDIVTGTSIGAINGAFVCNGQTDKLRGLWENITPEKVMVDGLNLSVREFNTTKTTSFLRELRNFGKQYLSGKTVGADITPFKEYVKAAVDIEACYKSPVRFGIVATKFPTLQLVDFDMQSVPEENFLACLHASSACFPIFPIEKIDNVNYVDGFYKDNLPIRLAFNMGAEEVIAIDMRLFSLEPQNKFYLSLPNVTYIAPYIAFGSMMDFSQEVIQKNMKLGYLDVMKHYRKIYGFQYNIKPFKIEKGFLSFVLKEFEVEAKHITKLIMKDVRGPMSEEDFFVRTMEIVADRLGVNDYYTLYSFDEFKELIRVKMVETIETESTFISSLRERLANLPFEGKRSILYRFLSDFCKYCLGIDYQMMLDERHLQIEESKETEKMSQE